MFKTPPARPQQPSIRPPLQLASINTPRLSTLGGTPTAFTTPSGTSSLQSSPPLSVWTLSAAATTRFFLFGLGRAPAKQISLQQTSPATTTLIPELSFTPSFKTFPSRPPPPPTSSPPPSLLP